MLVVRGELVRPEVPLARTSRSGRALRPCPCGHCRSLAGFCAEHEAVLARVRDELGTRSREIHNRGGEGNDAKRRGARPRCCNPACPNGRARGVRYCPDCEADGWSEES